MTIKITYNTPPGKNFDLEFDQKIKGFFEKMKFNLAGSGYNFKTCKRDLTFYCKEPKNF